MRPLPLLALLLPIALACRSAASAPAEHLYIWVASADTTQPDFLATLDVTEGSERYGQVVGTIAVPGRRNWPHHTEHELAPDRQLFANGFGAGRTFIFDLSKPEAPRIAGDFTDMAGYAHPHSFILMPNGNRLGTFQMRHDSAGMRAGGLVELTPTGDVARSSAPQPASIDVATRGHSGAAD